MIKLLIVDDEPLVQIGIKSMINWADLGVEICGTAMNGEAALKLIEEYSPEIVITDIKMPKMNGLELAKACRETYQAVDYLIKLELTPDSLTASVRRALERLEEYRASQAYRKKGGEDRPTLQGYHDKFFIRLLHNLFDSEEQFTIQSRDLRLDFSDSLYLAAHGEIHSDATDQMNDSQQINL